MASEEDDYEVYQYSDEDGYSVEEDDDDDDEMEWDSNENPNSPPVQYTKMGTCLLRPAVEALVRIECTPYRACHPYKKHVELQCNCSFVC